MRVWRGKAPRAQKFSPLYEAPMAFEFANDNIFTRTVEPKVVRQDNKCGRMWGFGGFAPESSGIFSEIE